MTESAESVKRFAASHAPHQLLLKIRAAYPSLKSAEQRAADFVLENPERMRNAGIVDVARGAGCSEATLVRLSRRLGYQGFPELKAECAGVTDDDRPLVYKQIRETDSVFSVAEKVFAAAIQSMRDTLNVIDRQAYEKAVELVLGARRILFCGLGDASSVAQAAYQKFVRIDADVMTAEDADLLMIMASHLTKGDLLIAISHSGKSVPVINAVRKASVNGAATIAITNFPYSPLAKRSDVVLLTADFAEHLQGEVVTKRLSELCILESLYINFLMRKRGRHLRALHAASEAVEIYKTQ